MCEIAVTKTPSDGIEPADVERVAKVLYQDNPDGLGLVAVHRIADEKFLYNRFKRTDPEFGDETDLRDFIDRNGAAWRFVIHARLATHGGENFASTHPIQTSGCPECDIDFVVHNGVVRNPQLKRAEHERKGHEYLTNVDSEVIAHSHGELPETLDEYEEPEIYGSLNYLLFGEKRILLRTTYKYEVDESRFLMATKRKGWISDGKTTAGFHLIQPDGSVDFKKRSLGQTKTNTISTVGAFRGGTARWSGTKRTQGSRSGTVSRTEKRNKGATCETKELARETAGSYTTADFVTATPGFLTVDPVDTRNWVIDQTKGVTGSYEWNYLCLLHDEEFNEECPVCETVDIEAMDNIYSSKRLSTKPTK